MIVIPPNTAPRRTLLLDGPGPLSATVTRIVLALALLFAAPAAAHAAGGGVALGGSATTTAKAADADPDEAAPTPRPRSVSKNQVRRAQTLLRVTPSGSNDVKTRKVVKRFQTLRGITTHGIIDLPTYLQIKDAFALLETGGVGVEIAIDPDATGGTAPTAPAPEVTLPPNLAPITPTEREILDRIAQCESKGDPTIVSSNGLYRGKYQFDRATWKSVGGTGDPAAATEVEQDQRAAILLRQKGTAPWPICGADGA